MKWRRRRARLRLPLRLRRPLPATLRGARPALRSRVFA
jgi:hypothetical protein